MTFLVPPCPWPTGRPRPLTLQKEDFPPVPSQAIKVRTRVNFQDLVPRRSPIKQIKPELRYSLSPAHTSGSECLRPSSPYRSAGKEVSAW